MGLQKLSIFYGHDIEHVSFSLEIKTMMVNLKLERTSVCAISYLDVHHTVLTLQMACPHLWVIKPFLVTWLFV